MWKCNICKSEVVYQIIAEIEKDESVGSHYGLSPICSDCGTGHYLSKIEEFAYWED